MVTLPADAAVAKPVALMFATAGLLELHTTESVRSVVVPLLYIPVALNCWVPPCATVAVVGLIDT